MILDKSLKDDPWLKILDGQKESVSMLMASRKKEISSKSSVSASASLLC